MGKDDKNKKIVFEPPDPPFFEKEMIYAKGRIILCRTLDLGNPSKEIPRNFAKLSSSQVQVQSNWELRLVL